MINQLQTAQWYANKATKHAAQGDMKKATECWQVAMGRFGEYHQGKEGRITAHQDRTRTNLF
ncbi:hypothetical protein MQM1_085 [Aeromonas phage vB_AsaP_MQM1]|nr:hypothetical protein MQM1_085 [Aeromonas phage vB_AsaP_MQM1]